MSTTPLQEPDDADEELAEALLLADDERAASRRLAGSIEALPVDRIEIDRGGRIDSLTPAGWVALSRRRRLDLIAGGAVVFRHGGRIVPLRSALVYLRSYAAGVTAGRRATAAITTKSSPVRSVGRFPPPRHSPPPPG